MTNKSSILLPEIRGALLIYGPFPYWTRNIFVYKMYLRWLVGEGSLFN